MFEKPLFSKVSSKGQTVIPAELRDKMKIQQGSVLHFQQLSINTFVIRVMGEGESVALRPTTIHAKIPAIGLKKTF
ncbi:AbrB/MazE/SpoVT family DNA-binding domain-containing protein [Brevibacillus centrosporus]|jgi:AbrB family looped-hinge helix DNA binding protein|uniref:AbrB/MazE/SpoVT family DNA-binding domain-containing protein n=1 Tax=Brevibacillus centrosporus TaxID=54910 RepID=UPI0039857EFD